MKVYITDNVPEIAEKLLKKNGIEYKIYKKPNPISKEEIIKNCRSVDGIISMLSNKIDADIIINLNNCKVIANFAVGFNNIDLTAAKEKNIAVTNTPDILTDATADLAMTLVLACCRRIREGEKLITDGKFTGWKPQLLLGYELRGKTFGIIGAGRIGQATAKRAKAFGTKIVYYNRSKKYEFEKETGAKKVSLNSLLKSADIISIHLPLDKKTDKLLNKSNMSLIKSSAIIINTARGEIIDEDVLIQMLKKKKLFSAGLDVYVDEPNIKKGLLNLSNVVLLPHLGSGTVEARNKMAELAAKNVINILSGKKAITPVV